MSPINLPEANQLPGLWPAHNLSPRRGEGVTVATLISDPTFCGRLLRFAGAARRVASAKGHTLSEGMLVAEWRAVEATKQVSERPIEQETRRLFEAQKREVVRQLHELAAAGALPMLLRLLRTGDRVDRSIDPDVATTTADGSISKDPLLVARLFDTSRWDREVMERLAPRLLSSIRAGYFTGLRRVAVEGVDFTSDSPRVTLTLREALRQATHINDTTAARLAAVVQTGLIAGDSLDQLARRIEADFDDFSGYRAQLSARTLGVMGFEAGQLHAFDRAGVERKRWLSQRDGRVRRGAYDHLAPDGQERAVSEPFEVSGELLQHPGDPAASLGNRINCRCTSLPVIS